MQHCVTAIKSTVWKISGERLSTSTVCVCVCGCVGVCVCVLTAWEHVLLCDQANIYILRWFNDVHFHTRLVNIS